MGICNPLSPDAYKYIVRVPLVSVYAFQWVLANQPDDGNGSSVDYVKSQRTTRRNNGAVIHEGTERLAQNTPMGKWHHVSIEVAGELMTDVDTEVLEPPLVQSTGNKSSLLKGRITLDMGNARIRKFDFDIGAGVEFDVVCYSVQKIEVLIPNPLVEIPAEPEAGGTITGPQQTATVLTTTVYMTHGSCCSQQPLSHTTPLFLVSAGDDTWFVPRTADSIEIAAGTTSDDIVIDFIYVPTGFRDASQVAPTGFFILDNILPGLLMPTRVAQVPIPGNANAYRVRLTGATTFVNLVQILNV